MPRKRTSIYRSVVIGKFNKRINAMADTKTVKDYEGKEVNLTSEPDSVKSGEVVESFKVTVSTKDTDTDEVKTHYTNDDEPFSWTKIDNIADLLKAHGAEISDDAIAFLGEALAGEKNGEAVASLIAQQNSVTRANAKNNQYQKVVNKFKPQSEEDKAKAFNRMVEIFAKQAGVTEEVARKMLSATMAGTKEVAA